jgi:GT2 family glycosyltransferase
MVGIVVLNYVQYDETIRCVDSLLEQQNVDFYIAVVDNGSGNESFSVLYEKYKDAEKVEVVETSKNLGFAKGMNYGINILLEKGCDFVFLANSDLVFDGSDILNKMVSSYEPGIGAICPAIRNTDGGQAVYITFKDKWLYLRMLKTFINGTLKNFKRKRYTSSKPSAYREIEQTGLLTDRYIITGSGYMLTPAFFEHYPCLYPETFLGLEEYATIIYLKKSGLKTFMAKTEPIIHKHGASTPKDYKTYASIYRGAKKSGYSKIIKLFFMTESGIKRKYER